MMSFLLFDSCRRDRFAVQRHDPFDLQMIGGDAFFVCQLLHRLADDPFGRAPAHQRHLRVLGAPTASAASSSGRIDFHLAHALFMHRLALVRVGVLVADQHAVFIMIVGGDDMLEARRARQRARRDAAVGELDSVCSRR